MSTNVEVEMFERIGKLVEQKDALVAALEAASERLDPFAESDALLKQIADALKLARQP